MALAFNPQDNQLYALGDDSDSGDNLYQIDKATGEATLIGNTDLVEADSLEFVGNGGTPDGIEPNDTIPEATGTGLLGEGFFSISTEIGDNPHVFPENEVDLFELELDSGDQLIADIDASDIGSELDPILSVFDSTGVLVAQNDDFESLAIDASAPFIDGPGGILGQAGPTVLREDSFLPARGIMEFDVADLELLEEEGLFEDVILHEMDPRLV